MIGGLDRTEVDEDNLSVNESVNEKVINIALYGVDSRNHDYNGRSDVVMVASVNTKTGQVKLVSIARDTYVAIPGYNNTRINHAFPMAGLSLPSAPSMKFRLGCHRLRRRQFRFPRRVIDAMGGVEVDVTEAERRQINAYLLSGEPLYETGYITLNGPQAVSLFPYP